MSRRRQEEGHVLVLTAGDFRQQMAAYQIVETSLIVAAAKGMRRGGVVERDWIAYVQTEATMWAVVER